MKKKPTISSTTKTNSTKPPKKGEIKKSILALGFGLILSFGLIVGVEIFFQLNRTHHWVTSKWVPFHPPTDYDWDLSRKTREEMGKGPVDDWEHPLTKYIWAPNEHREVKYQTGLPFYGEEPGVPQEVSVTSKTSVTGKTIYDVTYHFDKYSRRPVPENRGNEKTKIVLAGGSFAFAEGVSAKETTANFLSGLRKDTAVYSVSLPGFGPADILYEFEKGAKKTQGMTPKGGLAVFLVIDGHLERIVCKAFCARDSFNWTWRKPYYRMGANGQLEYVGTIENSAPWKWGWYRTVFGSAFLEYVGFPKVSWNDEDFDLVATVFNTLKTKMMEAADLQDFIVVFHPMDSGFLAGHLVNRLEKLGIKYLDYSKINMDTLTDKHPNLPMDGHPSPRAHYALAWLLNRDLPRIPPPQ